VTVGVLARPGGLPLAVGSNVFRQATKRKKASARLPCGLAALLNVRLDI
jgi:hypothetical protein